MKGKNHPAPTGPKQNPVGMTEANYNQPYATRVKFKGSQLSNNGSARTISGGNKRGRA